MTINFSCSEVSTNDELKPMFHQASTMKLFVCGCNLNRQLSTTVGVHSAWTLIDKLGCNTLDFCNASNSSLIAFGFSYIVYSCDNKIIIKGFDSHIDDRISIPKPLSMTDNDSEVNIINVSTYKNRIILIQSNGNIWKLDLVDKIKNVIQTEAEHRSQKQIDSQQETKRSHNRDEIEQTKPSVIEGQCNTNASPSDETSNEKCKTTDSRKSKESVERKTYQTNLVESPKVYKELVDGESPNVTSSQMKDVESFHIETPSTKCTEKMMLNRMSSQCIEGEAFRTNLTQINHLFTCELHLCDDETKSDSSEEERLKNTDEGLIGESWTDGHKSKKQRTSPRKRDYLRKSVCSDNIQLLLSQQGHVFHLPGRLDHFQGQVVTDIACGFDHSLALTQDGLVFSWGNGSRGQLGYVTSGGGYCEEPREIRSLSGLGVAQIAASGWHSVARTRDGFLYAWGWNNSGQVGVQGKLELVVHEPLPVSWSEDMDSQYINVTDIACGSRHTVALCDDSSVWGCGWNEYNQLSLGSDVSKVEVFTRLPLPDLPDHSCVVNVFAGHWNSAILVS